MSECQEVLDELGIDIEPQAELSDLEEHSEGKQSTSGIMKTLQKELEAANFYIPFDNITVQNETDCNPDVMLGRYFNGLKIRLVKRTPLNAYHLRTSVLPEIFSLKNSRHPSILLTLGATIRNGQLYLITEEPAICDSSDASLYTQQAQVLELPTYLHLIQRGLKSSTR